MLGAFTNGYYPLLAGSPAINAAVSRCRGIDQRGVSRPQGAGCDIGAYEYGGSARTSRSRSEPESEPEPAKTHRQNMAIANAELSELSEDHDIDVCHAGRWPVNGKFMKQGEMHMIIEGALPWGSLGGVDLYGGDKNVISASNPVEICFPDPGYLVIFDARQSPRQLRPLPTYRVGDRTCATVTYPGTVGNVPETRSRDSEGWFLDLGGTISSRERSNCDGAPVDTVPTSQESEPVWQPVPVTQCGSRTQEDGSVVHVVESGHHCWAIAEACGIFMEDIQRLNPEFGDCRMLHPGDELVVSAPPPSLTDGVSLSAEEIPYDDPEYIEMEGRVLLGVARCMRDYAEDHRAVSFAMIKREARKIAEEAWRNRGTNHWTAQLGDGRLIVDRKRTRSLFEDEEAILDSPACVEMGPGLDWTEIHTVIEPVTEEELEALRYAIVDMLRACGVRYAIVEREAPKIAQDALRDGVRDVHDLPAYRAMELGHLHNYPASISPRRARRTECFLLHDYRYLEDWGDHGDKDQLFNEHQIEEAEAQLEAIKEWAVAACDIALTAGTSGAIKVGTTGAKEAAGVVVKEAIEEFATLAVKEGAAKLSEATADERASARAKIAADFRTQAIKYIPTGPCSLFVSAVEYRNLVDEMKDALANLEEGQGVDDLDVFGEDIYCKIYSTDTVLAKGDPDPNRDGTELRLNASDAFSPLGTVEHKGEKYYVVQGTRGRGTSAVGGLITATAYNKSENRGHAFVPVSNVDATDSCKDLPDATSLYAGAANPQDLIGRQLVDLNVQEVPDAYANDHCKFKLAASESEKTEDADYSTVFMLCETYDGDSCKNLPAANEFVITHYNRRTTDGRVYVKSLDDDGKPEGWLKRKDVSVRYIPWLFGIRLLHETNITEQWIDPYHFNPENVTEGSRASGEPALCLPGETS